jgi:hypothetical protein
VVTSPVAGDSERLDFNSGIKLRLIMTVFYICAARIGVGISSPVDASEDYGYRATAIVSAKLSYCLNGFSRVALLCD